MKSNSTEFPNNVMELPETGSVFKSAAGNLRILELLGKSKSGYSYLSENSNDLVVLKILHNDPNPYYHFSGNKVDYEIESYKQLVAAGIKVPCLLTTDRLEGYLVKEFIDGNTALVLISEANVSEDIISNLFVYVDVGAAAGFNIDFFPANFAVTRADGLHYIDYEVNPYSEEWNLINRGIYYWANSEEFKMLIEPGYPMFINADVFKGIPIKVPFRNIAEDWINSFL